MLALSGRRVVLMHLTQRATAQRFTTRAFDCTTSSSRGGLLLRIMTNETRLDRASTVRWLPKDEAPTSAVLM